MGAHAGSVSASTFVAIGVVTAGMLLYAHATQRAARAGEVRERGEPPASRGGMQR
jgi:hypothetical protein